MPSSWGSSSTSERSWSLARCTALAREVRTSEPGMSAVTSPNAPRSLCASNTSRTAPAYGPAAHTGGNPACRRLIRTHRASSPLNASRHCAQSTVRARPHPAHSPGNTRSPRSLQYRRTPFTHSTVPTPPPSRHPCGKLLTRTRHPSRNPLEHPGPPWSCAAPSPLPPPGPADRPAEATPAQPTAPHRPQPRWQTPEFTPDRTPPKPSASASATRSHPAATATRPWTWRTTAPRCPRTRRCSAPR
ncbi:hypothetical protein Saa2_08674 [Streptomyces acidiscabies]|nr:hypothetical protein Saa2_08674 [Streptomyces acidiscabies]